MFVRKLIITIVLFFTIPLVASAEFLSDIMDWFRGDLAAPSVFFPIQGGTGTSTTPGDDTIFLGNADGTYNTKTLTAGANITFTETGTALTITGAAGGGGGTGNVATSSAETKGQLPYWTSTGATPATLGGIATSSPTIGTGLSYSGTIGAFVGGTDGTLTLNAGFADLNGVSTSSDATGDIYYLNSAGNIVNLGIGSNGQVLTLAAGIPSWAAASGGSAFAWTPGTTYGENANATTTPIWFQDTLYASSTSFFTGLATFENSTTTHATVTNLYVGTDQVTDLTGTGLTLSGTSLTTTLGTSIDISDETNLAATWPVILTGDTLSFGGLSTSTAAVVGNIPYFSGVNTFDNVATTTLTIGTGLSSSATHGFLVGGSNATLSLNASFNDLNGVSTSTDATGDIYYLNSAGNIVNLGIGSNSNVLSISGGVPTWTATSSTDLQDLVTLAGSLDYLTISGQVITRNAIDLTTDTTGTLGETSGGTGQSTYTAGDILYSDSANSLAKLPAGTNGNILGFQSGVPAWIATTTFAHLNIANAFTNTGTTTFAGGIQTAGTIDVNSSTATSTYANGIRVEGGCIQVGIGSECLTGTDNPFQQAWDVNSLGLLTPTTTPLTVSMTNASSTIFSAGLSYFGGTATSTFDTAGNLSLIGNLVISGDTINDFAGTGLTVSGNALTADLGTSVTLTSEVDGILPIANGGTASSSPSRFLFGTGSTLVSTSTISEIWGGTGNTTYALGDLLYGDATNSLGKLTASTTERTVLMIQSGLPVWEYPLISREGGSFVASTSIYDFNSGDFTITNSGAGVTSVVLSSNVTQVGAIDDADIPPEIAYEDESNNFLVKQGFGSSTPMSLLSLSSYNDTTANLSLYATSSTQTADIFNAFNSANTKTFALDINGNATSTGWLALGDGTAKDLFVTFDDDSTAGQEFQVGYDNTNNVGLVLNKAFRIQPVSGNVPILQQANSAGTLVSRIFTGATNDLTLETSVANNSIKLITAGAVTEFECDDNQGDYCFAPLGLGAGTTSPSLIHALGVTGDTLLAGTTTISDTAGTATSTIVIGTTAKPGCLIMRDTDAAGWSYGYIRDGGSITWSTTVSCE